MDMVARVAVLTTLGLSVVMGLTTAAAQSQWVVTNLNPSGATQSHALGVSGSRQVGMHIINEGHGALFHASLWNSTAASWINLAPAGAWESWAYGASENQQVGGAYFPGSPLNPRHASLWQGTAGSWVDLRPAGWLSSEAYGVADGQQVGYVSDLEGHTHASLWSGTAESFVDLHPAGAIRSFASAVSGGQQGGRAVFLTENDGYVYYASLWSGTAASWVNLNPAGALRSRITGISNGQQAGWAVVVVNGQTNYHASVWNGTAESWIDLHYPPNAQHTIAFGVAGGYQVGCLNCSFGASDGDGNIWGFSAPTRACLWSGTPESLEDLHQFLPGPPDTWSMSLATGVWTDGHSLYVSGYARRPATGREEAMLWRKAIACGTSDFNGDGDYGTDADISAFFSCLAGNCCPTCFAGGADFNADGDGGTDEDIEAFFRVLGGQAC